MKKGNTADRLYRALAEYSQQQMSWEEFEENLDELKKIIIGGK